MRKNSAKSIDEERVTLWPVVKDAQVYQEIVGRAKPSMQYYEKILNGPGVFCTLMREEILRMAPGDDQAMLVPMNYLLWFYALGIRKDSRKLGRFFKAMAWNVHEILRMPGNDFKLRLQDMPLGRSFRELLAGHEQKMGDKKYWQFNTLQELICALCFASIGRRLQSSTDLILEAVWSAAPIIGYALDIPKEIRPESVTACYSDRPYALFNTSLFVLARAKSACMLLLELLTQAAPLHRSETSVATREEMAVRMLTTMRVSLSDDWEYSRMVSSIFSNSYIV